MADKKAACSMKVALTGQGTPPNGVFSAVATCFSVHRSDCMRLWKQIQGELDKIPSNQDEDDPPPNNILLDRHMPAAVFETKTADRRKGKCKCDRAELQAKVAAIPFSKRRRTRMLAAQLEMSQSSLMHILKEKGSCVPKQGPGVCLPMAHGGMERLASGPLENAQSRRERVSTELPVQTNLLSSQQIGMRIER